MFEYMIDGKQYRDDPQMIYDRLVIECNGDPGALADQVNADDSPMLAARGRLKIDEVIRAVFRLPPPNAGGPGWDQTMRLWNQFWTYSDQKKKQPGTRRSPQCLPSRAPRRLLALWSRPSRRQVRADAPPRPRQHAAGDGHRHGQMAQ